MSPGDMVLSLVVSSGTVLIYPVLSVLSRDTRLWQAASLVADLEVVPEPTL